MNFRAQVNRPKNHCLPRMPRKAGMSAMNAIKNHRELIMDEALDVLNDGELRTANSRGDEVPLTNNCLFDR